MKKIHKYTEKASFVSLRASALNKLQQSSLSKTSMMNLGHYTSEKYSLKARSGKLSRMAAMVGQAYRHWRLSVHERALIGQMSVRDCQDIGTTREHLRFQFEQPLARKFGLLK